MKISLLLLILGFFLLCSGVLTKFHHTCTHDEIFKEQKQKTYKISHFERMFRKKQQTSIQSIRIVMDYSNLKLTGDQRTNFIKIMDLAKNFFVKRLKVLSTGRNTILPSSLLSCVQTTVPNAHRRTGFNGDLIIYATASVEREDTAAWASFCHQDPLNGRPLAGQINFGLGTLESIKSPKDFQTILGVAIHEITHILAFNNRLYKDFRKSFGSLEKYETDEMVAGKVKIGIREKFLIRTPKVVETARKYFNCDTMPGVELEDEGSSGSAGSHWERSILNNEMMGAQTMEEETFSIFSLSLLEDSGWYKPDYSFSEPIYFGKGAGCSFVERVTCYPEHHPGRNEWCNPDVKTPLCSLSGRYKGECSSNKFASCCFTNTANSFYLCENADSTTFRRSYEYYGPSSRCYIGDLKGESWETKELKNMCLKSLCNDAKTEISIYLSSTLTVTCNIKGQNITLPEPFEGTLLCPDPEIHCQNWRCPRDCSRNGYCNKNKCECLQGWEGEDCLIKSGSGSVSTTVEIIDLCQNVICTGNRFCEDGVCQCLDGFVGPNCLNECPKNCSGNGHCIKSKCFCGFGYSGNDCSVKEYCTKACNHRGFCFKEKCYCLEGFSGEDCEITAPGYDPRSGCPSNCNWDSFRGKCRKIRNSDNSLERYSCYCHSGSLPDCARPPPSVDSSCSLNCGDNGKCEDGKCICTFGYGTEDCSKSGCIDNCSDRGECELISQFADSSLYVSRRYCSCKDGSKGMFCPS